MDSKVALLTACAIGSLAIGADLTAAPAADAAPAAYVNAPLDTVNAAVNVGISNINAQVPALSLRSSCSGNTTGTCTGDRIVMNVTNLTTTAGGNLSAAVTVTDSAVAAASDLQCSVEDYAGNGTPAATLVTANAGNLTLKIQNTAVSGGAALDATVPVFCTVYN